MNLSYRIVKSEVGYRYQIRINGSEDNLYTSIVFYLKEDEAEKAAQNIIKRFSGRQFPIDSPIIPTTGWITPK